MNNSPQQLFSIYQNIHHFYDYRGLVSLDARLEQKEFVAQMQLNKYMLLTAVSKDLAKNSKSLARVKALVGTFNEKSDPTGVEVTHVLLVHPDSECETKSANLFRLITHIRYPKASVLIVMQQKASSLVLRGLKVLESKLEHRSHSFKTYTYALFTSVLPEHELVPAYKILTAAEVAQLRENFIEPGALPKVFENDPQMVWLGAAVGDVVKFTHFSEVTIQSIGYCQVIKPQS